MFRAVLRLQWRGSAQAECALADLLAVSESIDEARLSVRQKWLSARRRVKSLALAAAMNEERRKSINQETQNE
jgi:hypothetical protein